MRVVRLWDILLAYLLIFACAGFLVAGVFKPWYFAASGVALALYFLWSFLRLRCPWCGVSVDLTKFLRGLRKNCNCPNCGHEITVVLYVKKASPSVKGRGKPDNNNE